MVKYITMGKFNKNYFFLLGSVLVRLIKAFINGFKLAVKEKKIYLFNYQPFFIKHPFFKKSLQYFSFVLFGLILELIYYKINNKSSKDKEDESKENNNDGMDYDSDNINIVINNDVAIDKIGEINDKKNIGKISLVLLCCFISQFVGDLMNNLAFYKIKFWPIEYIFLIIFSKKILKKILYRHQKCSLLTLIIFCTIIYTINSIFPLSLEECVRIGENKVDNCTTLDQNIYQKISSNMGWHFILIIITIYLITMAMNSFSTISFKWLIDIQYITITRIIIYIGIIGFIFSFTLFFTFPAKPCESEIGQAYLNDICQIEDDKKLYYENFRALGKVVINTNFYIDIFIVLILYLIASFLNIFFSFMIIKNLDPFYLIPIDSIYYIITEIIDYFLTLNKANVNRHVKFAFKIFNNGVCIVLSLIYFELIELHFCGLDQYLRRNILKREILDKQFLLYDMNEEEEEEDGNQ